MRRPRATSPDWAGRVVRIAAAVVLGAVLVALVVQVAALRGQETDLFPRWYGLRQLLIAGRNPYSDAVSREIAAQTWFLAYNLPLATLVAPIERVFGFLYPLPGALLLTPLAFLPYPLALAVWLLGVVFMIPAAAWLVVDAATADTRATPGGRLVRALALPLGLLFFPTLANLALAQPAPAVAFCVALALWLAGRRNRSGAFAGGLALAAAAALKPQLLVLVGPLWIGRQAVRWVQSLGRSRAGPAAGPAPAGRSARRSHPPAADRSPDSIDRAVGLPGQPGARRRERVGSAIPGAPGAFLLGLAAGGIGLSLAAFALLPAWPQEFARVARHYPEAISAAPALLVGTQLVLPEVPALTAAAIAAAAAIGWAVAGWLQHLDDTRAVARTVLATALVFPPAWETNAVMLLIPLAAALASFHRRRRDAILFLAAVVAISALDVPLYLTLEWRRGAAIILGYAALLLATAVVTSWAATGVAGRGRRPLLHRRTWHTSTPAAD